MKDLRKNPFSTSERTLNGKGKESDPTDASVDTSGNASVDAPPTRRRRWPTLADVFSEVRTGF